MICIPGTWCVCVCASKTASQWTLVTLEKGLTRTSSTESWLVQVLGSFIDGILGCLNTVTVDNRGESFLLKKTIAHYCRVLAPPKNSILYSQHKNWVVYTANNYGSGHCSCLFSRLYAWWLKDMKKNTLERCWKPPLLRTGHEKDVCKKM